MNSYDFSYSYSTSSEAAEALAGMGVTVIVIALIAMVLSIVAMWKIFAKAGEPGWGSIVPFYSQYLQFKIAFGNGWLFLLLFIPIVNAIMMIIYAFKLAGAFGKGIGFGFGLLFLPFIFHLILAFGSSEFKGAEI